MDVLLLILNALLTVWWVLPIFIVVGLLRLPAVKGWIGEGIVKLSFKLFLDKAIYHQLHNVTLPTLDGTTQIDHIVASPYGIFVVETKNMQGWIFGSESQAQWTQKIYRNSYRFQNPLRQNYKHVKAVESALLIAPETIHSLVVFIGGATLKTEMPDNVQHGGGGIRFIKSFTEPVFSEEKTLEIVGQLQSGRLAQTRATHREHVERLQMRSDVTAERLCPKCGSALVVRVTKAGANAGERFWGCSAYPKCRTVQRIPT
ncbi:MAG: NERD domain-containing protein [Gammaproteobacteria bacterium]|nr:NERD domain-containing protein [Gammaproteobacteria bacterium]MDP2348210.1 NERD domain-containing protein [Gammaproteobacteria bacterium]